MSSSFLLTSAGVLSNSSAIDFCLLGSRVELLAQVTVKHVLDWVVIRSVTKVISAKQGRIYSSQVHLQVKKSWSSLLVKGTSKPTVPDKVVYTMLSDPPDIRAAFGQ